MTEETHTALIHKIYKIFIDIISETNGISLHDTLELIEHSNEDDGIDPEVINTIKSFKDILFKYHEQKEDISILLAHPVAKSLFLFFKDFPISFMEEHIHLSGSLSPSFIYPHLKKMLQSPQKDIYEKKIKSIYGEKSLPIKNENDLKKLITIKDNEDFETYLKILFLTKLILNSREMHKKAAYHLAQELFTQYNVGKVRLKFTYSRGTTYEDESDLIPGIENLSPDDVILGLYDGFMEFKKEVPSFDFVLSPCFRKESTFFDNRKFKDKTSHFNYLVQSILKLLEKNPELRPYLDEVDTVGDEKNHYRKSHFFEMQKGLRKLQFHGFKIRSHHGETWLTLKKGIQAVDNALNIWNIDTLEHGLSLGVNPNYYFHRLYQRVLKKNKTGQKIDVQGRDCQELLEMKWGKYSDIKKKLLNSSKLSDKDIEAFIKVKFHTALEVERYQHDVLNRAIDKNVSLTALPSSNRKLTTFLPDYRDHPFSWWEKKGITLGIGTDNYITLKTNFIQEMLIILFSDPFNLKIMKLIMVATGESRRPYLSHLLWTMRLSSKRSDIK